MTGCVYDGADHQVVALAGTSVRLRSGDGAESVVLVAYLMASPGIRGHRRRAVAVGGTVRVMDGLPVKVLEAAREWERHIVEVETGLAPGTRCPARHPAPGYRPGEHDDAERGTKPRRPSWA